MTPEGVPPAEKIEKSIMKLDQMAIDSLNESNTPFTSVKESCDHYLILINQK